MTNRFLSIFILEIIIIYFSGVYCKFFIYRCLVLRMMARCVVLVDYLSLIFKKKTANRTLSSYRYFIYKDVDFFYIILFILVFCLFLNFKEPINLVLVLTLACNTTNLLTWLSCVSKRFVYRFEKFINHSDLTASLCMLLSSI